MRDTSIVPTSTGEIRRGRPLAYLLARNTLFNLLTQGFLLLIAVWSLPRIINGLSKDAFGLLTIIWAFVGYFTLLDFGISRANTKFLAEAIATGDVSQTRNLIWTSLSLTFIVGVVSGGVLIALTPLLVTNVFNVSTTLSYEASQAFLFAAISIPFMLLFGILKGFQMAIQRFDLVNTFQSILGVAQWVGPIVLLYFGYGLTAIIMLTVGVRIILTLVSLSLLPRLIPGLMTQIRLWDGQVLKKLFSFGGWITLSQVISPLFLYADRFFIGTFLSLSAVTFYTVPQEALTRVLIIPMSLTMTLFPALSEESAREEDSGKIGKLYVRSVKYLLFGVLPVVVILIVYASDILNLWVGSEFRLRSAASFQILSVGLLFNAMAQIPTTVLHARGRPDITAKFHLVEFPLMILLNLILIPIFGIIGAAITWTFRVTADSLLLFWAVNKTEKNSFGRLVDSMRIGQLAFQVLILLAIFVFSRFVEGVFLKLGLTVIMLGAYSIGTWMYGFDDKDREYFIQFRSRMFE